MRIIQVSLSAPLIQILRLWHNVFMPRLWLNLKWLGDWCALIVLGNQQDVRPTCAAALRGAAEARAVGQAH